MQTDQLKYFKQKLLESDNISFHELTLEVFRFQSQHNEVYKKYLDHLGISSDNVNHINQIPFLPIEFFKNHEIRTGNWVPEKKFLSSGTTTSIRSQHLIEDIEFYRLLALRTFTSIYKKQKKTTILALLPSYQEQGNSGLIDMVEYFISLSESDFSGFYLDDYSKLSKALEAANKSSDTVILFGVSYALLEFSKYINQQFADLIIMETGGMKGRGPELTKMEMYDHLKKSFGTERIHSEYGMTELMSQAYSQDSNCFQSPPWMEVIIRDINDPFKMLDQGKVGGMNIIDLANIHSCSFIETKDIGRVNIDKKFEILGRIDNSDLRGCNLLVN